MDLQELLDRADYNTTESRYKASSGIVKYSSVLPPPKKMPKANVQSENIKRFLEKKKREEEAKVAEAKKQREQLLALRAQSTKNSKKAKIMASRTKDNDFSRIKLSEDEIEAKKKREAEIIRKNLNDKVERMKMRIEMEEKEKLLPRKRKRKSKNGDIVESVDDHHEDLSSYKESTSNGKNYDKISSDRTNNIRKPPRPPPPNLSIQDLLKLAEKKMHEPMDVVVKKKEEEKLMTKKERKIMEEDLARQRRKQEMKLAKSTGNSSKPPSSAGQTAPLNKIKTVPTSEKSEVSKKPFVIHVERDVLKPQRDEKFKIPKSGGNVPIRKDVPSKDCTSSSNVTKLKSSNPSAEKSAKSSPINGHKKFKSQDERFSTSQETNTVKKVPVPKQNGLKVSKSSEGVKKSEPQPKIDAAELERKITEKLEREMEERLTAKILAQLQASQAPKVPETPKPIKKEPVNNKKPAEKPSLKPTLNPKREMEMNEIKKKILEQRNNKPKIPEKKPFHKNPYLDPPRRLLEPQRPPKPVKRRIESDDEDDDDDDMSDFIDDGPSQNEEDYSKYIKEIFNYDRSRYEDMDDDDIKETSFAEQMKEEVRSARLGYLEDLEEERLEMERMKKKKKKK